MLQTIPGHRVLAIVLSKDTQSFNLRQGGDGSVGKGEGDQLKDRRERVRPHLPQTGSGSRKESRIRIRDQARRSVLGKLGAKNVDSWAPGPDSH